MQILDNLFNPQLGNLGRAMEKTTKRHGMLVANLANVNTPGYKRQDLDFSIELDQAEAQGSKLAQWRRQAEDHQSDNTASRVEGSNVDLEREVYSLADTEMHYQVLTEMANRYFSGLKSVIREGK